MCRFFSRVFQIIIKLWHIFVFSLLTLSCNFLLTSLLLLSFYQVVEFQLLPAFIFVQLFHRTLLNIWLDCSQIKSVNQIETLDKCHVRFNVVFSQGFKRENIVIFSLLLGIILSDDCKTRLTGTLGTFIFTSNNHHCTLIK